ncbi:hypothetical protein M514_04912, partial [Trichuris suis]
MTENPSARTCSLARSVVKRDLKPALIESCESSEIYILREPFFGQLVRVASEDEVIAYRNRDMRRIPHFVHVSEVKMSTEMRLPTFKGLAGSVYNYRTTIDSPALPVTERLKVMEEYMNFLGKQVAEYGRKIRKLIDEMEE